MLKKILHSYVTRIIISILYTTLFYMGYTEFLYGYFRYMGFGIIQERQSNITLLIFTYIIIIIPTLFYRGIKNISSLISIFIYFILYIPIVFTFYINSTVDNDTLIFLQCSFLFGMTIFFCADRIHFKNKIVLPANIDVFKIVHVFCLLFTLYVVIKYRSNLKIVSFENVYEQRLGNDSLGGDVFTAYITLWLSYVLVPVCVTYGLFSGKRLYILTGTIGSIVIYMAIAAKSVLFFPFFIFLMYRFLKNRNLNLSYVLIGFGLMIVMFISLQSSEFNMFNSIFWMRTIGNGGLLTNYYQKFFSEHPHTYYSHINVVNFITRVYPYDTSLGQVVGREYWDEDNNVNANFWATDGFAALGNAGILVSSVLLFVVLLVINKVCENYNKLFIILVLVPYINALLNTSLFTSLVTGGGLITLLILSFSTTMNNKYIINKTNKV